MSYTIDDNNFHRPIPKYVTNLLINTVRPINKIKFPDSLTTITFCDSFNEKIDYIHFPESLKTIYFGWNFNQSICNVYFPRSLTTINFGWSFDYPIINNYYLSSLKKIIINKNYKLENCKENFEIDGTIWIADKSGRIGGFAVLIKKDNEENNVNENTKLIQELKQINQQQNDQINDLKKEVEMLMETIKQYHRKN